jgi:hypothetical protein
MIQIVKIRGGRLTLPPEATELIGSDAEVTVMTTGDVIILKKMTPSRLSEIAKRAANDKPMTLREISREVHHARQSRRADRR